MADDKVGQRVHFSFPDPAKAVGTEEEIMAEFRKVRDDIRERLKHFYESEIRKAL